ncbi:MAG: hypothetical protein PVI23_12095 [Maricaulaceae bacterium]|jgi:hypothetical protein
MTMSVIRTRTAIAVLAAMGGATAHAAAQDGTVERCRAEPTIEAQLACLEAAVAAYEGVEAGETPAAPVLDAPASNTIQPPTSANPASAIPAPISPPPSSASEVIEQPEGLGAEQVVARMPPAQRPPEEEVQPETAHIVAHDIHGYDQLEVTLDNGQVWRQLQGDRTRVRLRGDDPIAVTITPSRFGGYRMHISEPRREIQVERIR